MPLDLVAAEFLVASGAAVAAGVNRASVAVQDFHPEVQAAINRIQPFAVTARVIGWLRRHGIAWINMDLVYGLPHQTAGRVRHSRAV